EARTHAASGIPFLDVLQRPIGGLVRVTFVTRVWNTVMHRVLRFRETHGMIAHCRFDANYRMRHMTADATGARSLHGMMRVGFALEVGVTVDAVLVGILHQCVVTVSPVPVRI